MAKLEYNITFDASIIADAFKKGLELGFILAVETPELDEQLNINKIDDAE